MPKITWVNVNQTIEVKAGTTLLDAAIEYDIPLEHVCGGCCACTTCRVQVKAGSENLSEMRDDEQELVETLDEPSKIMRLGCQTKVMGDVTVEYEL